MPKVNGSIYSLATTILLGERAEIRSSLYYYYVRRSLYDTALRLLLLLRTAAIKTAGEMWVGLFGV